MSYARLVRPPGTSAGKRAGQSSGKKIGNAHLKWALSEAMTILIRESPAAKDRLLRPLRSASFV